MTAPIDPVTFAALTWGAVVVVLAVFGYVVSALVSPTG